MNKIIRVLCLGAGDWSEVEWLARALHKTFAGSRVEVEHRPFTFANARAWRGDQFSAEAILDCIRAEPHTTTLALVERDLFVPSLNFVFGLAQPSESRALVALPRLREGIYDQPRDRELFRARLLKEAVHELGHVFGLAHCASRRCVMCFSNTLADADFKSAAFCERCRESIPTRVELGSSIQQGE